MKRGTPEHPKTVMLSGLLGIPKYGAVGILEMLFHFTSKYTPAGDIGKFSNASLASSLNFDGDPDELIASLIMSGFVDESSECRLVMHDWHEHADDSVHCALARKNGYFATNGSEPKLTRLARSERERIEEEYKKKRKKAHGERTASAGKRPALPSHSLPSHSLPSMIPQTDDNRTNRKSSPGGSEHRDPFESHPHLQESYPRILESMAQWPDCEQPKSPAEDRKWKNVLRLAIERDKKSEGDVVAALLWLFDPKGYQPRDDFDWRKNVRSLAGLRKDRGSGSKLTQIIAEWRSSSNQHRKTTGNLDPTNPHDAKVQNAADFADDDLPWEEFGPKTDSSGARIENISENVSFVDKCDKVSESGLK